MTKIWIVLMAGLLGACSEQARQTDDTMPAGFLDEAPPPPTSNVLVLSGGHLVLDDVTADTAIVLRDGKLIAWGTRGDVDMPNDSIGHDMRGKWVTPGTIADLKARRIPNLSALQQAAPANMLIFKTGPDLGDVTDDDLYGIISEGKLQIFDAESG